MLSLDALALEVVARPHDEAVRELYAEAVAPTDLERAGLIRLQLTMARSRRGTSTSPTPARRQGTCSAASG